MTPRDAALGRLILLASAYAPAAIIIGLRAMPATEARLSLCAGLIGLWVWAAFLWWLPRAQPRPVVINQAQPVDPEVTGYIVSYLLPVVAAASPKTGDLLAYGVCAALILVVAWAADLGAVNPLVYLFRLRVSRVLVNGHPTVVLARGVPTDGQATITRAAGVTFVLPQSSEPGNAPHERP
ncbi:MAG TPA: hypothetical protein VN238_03485 [Solirubrobacteraceae bacterium]|nr:hypothetical protein [Solirubrobacteraceae bacterium]